MNVTELIKKLMDAVSEGYGRKEIYIDGGQENFNIDSIQRNTQPNVEPDYFLIMAGKSKNEN